MGRVPAATVEEILRRVDMEALVSRYTTLRRQGSQLVGLCPFHSEKTPSFWVHPEKKVFKCYGCQEQGGVLAFVQKIETLSREQVLERLGEEVGVQVTFVASDDPVELHRRRVLEVLERCSHYYHELLVKSPLAVPAREYLVGRGVAVVSGFRLGWAPESGVALLRCVTRAGYSEEEGLAAGVLVERHGKVQDALRGRVVFPIMDAQDRVLAFGGRVLDDRQPKYLNTPESLVYSKRRHLYGLNVHRQAISRQDRAVVVEGYLDVISLSQVGLGIGVASLGTSLTMEQCQLLGQYTRNVIMAYDADRAGQVATVKGIELFENARLHVRIARLPAGEDPDSLARKQGAAAVEDCLRSAVEVVEYHLARFEESVDVATPDGKARFIREVQPAIERIRDGTKRDALIVQLAKRLHVTEQQLLWRFRSRTVAEQSRVVKGFNALDAEVRLFRVLAQYPEWVERVRGKLEVESLRREVLKPLFAVIFQMEGRTRPLGLEYFGDHVEEEGLLSELLIEEPPLSAPEDVDRLVKDIQVLGDGARYERLRREIVQAMADGTLNPNDERFQEYQRLSRSGRFKGT